MPNVDLDPPGRLPIFRRIALGTWATTYDPQVYGTMVLRMEPALAYLEAIRKRTQQRVTVTHLVAKAVALALKEMPDANALLRFGRLYPRKSIDVFLQVVMTDPVTGKPDLSGVTLRQVDRLSLLEIVAATEASVKKVRNDEDKAMAKSRGLLGRIPGMFVGHVLRFLSFLLYTLNLDLSGLGLAKDGFGSVMVTNIGSLGLEQAFAPLVPWSRVPMVVAAGMIVDEAVVENGQLVPGKVMRLSATFDHRFLDGAHAATLAKVVRAAFADPARAFGDVEA
jgi:pyruvate/2-oxoglutarate dehydrogenase complex dihydrolipoamide acyltransferase (E2) component